MSVFLIIGRDHTAIYHCIHLMAPSVLQRSPSSRGYAPHDRIRCRIDFRKSRCFCYEQLDAKSSKTHIYKQGCSVTSMSLSLLYFALPSAVLANVHAQAVAQNSLYLFNNTQTVPGTSSVLKFDLTAKTYETVASINTLPTSATNRHCPASSIVCGDKFYAVWTDVPIASGILQASISTGKMAFNTGAQGTVYPARWPAEKKRASFSLSKTVAGTSDSVVVQASKYDFDSNTDTVIGSFPDSNFAGYDTMYKFTADGKQCFAQFPESIDREKVKTGTLYIMDTASGGVDSYKFPKDVGLGYDIFPADSKTFSVSFVDYQTQKTKLCTEGTVSNTVDKSRNPRFT